MLRKDFEKCHLETSHHIHDNITELCL